MTTKRTVLLTGGAGFIGSHTSVQLLEDGYDVVIVDNHSNSHPSVVDRIEKIGGPLSGYYRLDIRDQDALRRVFADHCMDAVIHFAGKKSVSESVSLPLDYYDNNVSGTTALLTAMQSAGVGGLVFSSSCSIYGDGHAGIFDEAQPPHPTNPYARSKLMCEQIIADTVARYPELRAISLRYFNPAGAHPSRLLGEDPIGTPSNLVPFVAQVAVGTRPSLNVYGADYDTPDGSCIRDYIHVVDVARAHVLAVSKLDAGTGHTVMNLGTGVGTSVLELVRAFEAAAQRPIPCRIAERRPGDVPRLIADPTTAAREWGWTAEYDLARICTSAWEFQQHNRDGYDK